MATHLQHRRCHTLSGRNGMPPVRFEALLIGWVVAGEHPTVRLAPTLVGGRSRGLLHPPAQCKRGAPERRPGLAQQVPRARSTLVSRSGRTARAWMCPGRRRIASYRPALLCASRSGDAQAERVRPSRSRVAASRVISDQIKFLEIRLATSWISSVPPCCANSRICQAGCANAASRRQTKLPDASAAAIRGR
jgi:hypothetical protein